METHGGKAAISRTFSQCFGRTALRGVEWVYVLFLFPLVLGKVKLPHVKLGLFV